MNYLKDSIKKIYRSILNRFDPEPELTSEQSIAFDIFKISLYDDDNIRYLNTYELGDTYKRYIVTKTYLLNKEVNTFIILHRETHSSVITIVNHQYKYTIDMPPKTFSKMIEMFNKKVEDDRDSMEKEIMCNITLSLGNVLKELQSKVDKQKETN